MVHVIKFQRALRTNNLLQGVIEVIEDIDFSLNKPFILSWMPILFIVDKEIEWATKMKTKDGIKLENEMK